MENILKIKTPILGFEKINIEDFDYDMSIKIYSDTHDLVILSESNRDMDDSTIFNLWIEFGKYKEKQFMFNMPMEELELFCNSVLKHIDIIKNNYSNQIDFQIKKNNII